MVGSMNVISLGTLCFLIYSFSYNFILIGLDSRVWLWSLVHTILSSDSLPVRSLLVYIH